MFRFGAESKMMRMRFQSGMLYSAKFLDRLLTPFTMDEMIRWAITEKKLLGLDYDGYHRIIETHVYGRKNDLNGILAYQIEGHSSDGELGWKRLHMYKMANMRVLDETFPGKREVPNEHSKWDLKYLIVDR